MDTQNPSVLSVSPLAFNARIGRPNPPLVLDVRRPPRFDESLRLLACAQRYAPEDVAALAASKAPCEVFVYCVYGHNVSEEAVTVLQAAGWNAHRVAGGIEGGQSGEDDPQVMAQWHAQPPLSFAKRADWGVTGEQPSRWITRERPKIDRIACPWLIRRFIDTRAEFFYVPTSQVLAQAKALGAVAYDIPGAALGLLAFSLGLSRLHAPDDHAMLEAAMPLYDALYAWCRDRVAKQDEPHNWEPETMVAGAPA